MYVKGLCSEYVVWCLVGRISVNFACPCQAGAIAAALPTLSEFSVLTSTLDQANMLVLELGAGTGMFELV